MKNQQYWQERFLQQEKLLKKESADMMRSLESVFKESQMILQDKIDNWIIRVALNNNVSIGEARKLLTKGELEEFKWSIEKYIEAGQNNAMLMAKQLENASARVHISRLEAMKMQIQFEMERLYGNQLDALDDLTRKIYTEGYYNTMFEVSKGFGIGFNVAKINSNTLDRLVAKPWAADGRNFSDRLWTSKSQMVNELQKELTRMTLLGESPDKAIEHMSKFVDKKYGNAKVQAGRLVMTESAYFNTAAQKDAFNDLDVEWYEIVATLDRKTSEICQSLDGKHFEMKTFEPGVTAPPFHPWCRTTTCPFFPEDDFEPGMRAARDEDGKTYYVPADMTYPEWKEKFVETAKKNVIMKLAKELGIRGIINLEPKSINLNKYSFDDDHINKKRKHNVTRQEAINYMNDAAFSIEKWKGRYINFYAEEGAVFIDKENKNIRTAFKRKEFDDKIRKLMNEVLISGKD